MKNLFASLLLMALFTACNNGVDAADIAKINGYWEIEKVVMPNGEEKDYGANMSYDFFELKGNVGFRKKVMPQLDGTFLTNDLSEKLKVTFENEATWLNYTTPYTKWREELRELSDSEMLVVNAQNISYYYKKTGPINLMGDGKKDK